MRLHKTLVLALVAVAVMMLPSVAAAQLKPEDAKLFMGGWALGLESPQGALVLNLTLKVDGGKVAGQISNEMLGDSAISDVTKAGEALVLKYVLDVQGQSIPAKITMTPAGDKMNVEFDFADGQFMVPGTATKK